jgi:hypothetical protein
LRAREPALFGRNANLRRLPNRRPTFFLTLCRRGVPQPVADRDDFSSTTWQKRTPRLFLRWLWQRLAHDFRPCAAKRGGFPFPKYAAASADRGAGFLHAAPEVAHRAELTVDIAIVGDS